MSQALPDTSLSGSAWPLIFSTCHPGFGVLSQLTTFLSIAVVGADRAEVDDFAEEAINDDEVHGHEALRFSDTYFMSPQEH